MNCPRCKSSLQEETIKDINVSIQVDCCIDCGGKWFDKGELAKVEGLIEPTILEIRKIPNKTDQLTPLQCPSCDSKHFMQKVEHRRDKKVIIDYCTSCKGIWLDKGELEAIQKENYLITIGKLLKWVVMGR